MVENVVYETVVYDFSELLQVSTLEYELLQKLLEDINLHLNNISAGLQIIIYIAVSFLVWKVITVLAKLFDGWFLGGL